MRSLLALVSSVWVAASIGGAVVGQAPYSWSIPNGFPRPPVPADNPISEPKVELGRHLFYDTRLSGNGRQSCATCHEQRLAFTDGRARSVGSTGELHPRSSMSLVNVAYAATLTWADPGLTRLEDQALVPMYGDHPVELGLSRNDAWIDALKGDRSYAPLFAAAFGDDGAGVSRTNILKALGSFQRAIVSARSPYDRYHFDRDDTAVSDAARRGEVLFHSRPLSCFTCHGGFNFTGAVVTEQRPANDAEFHNTGLYNLAGFLSYPEPNTGTFAITRNPKDVGKFKAPTLRNIAVTAPYMHDGSAATLEDVLNHYVAGGRTIASGPYQGVGHDNPNKSPTIRGFALTREQRDDLIAFLQSLTDDELLRDRRFSNPWPVGSRK